MARGGWSRNEGTPPQDAPGAVAGGSGASGQSRQADDTGKESEVHHLRDPATEVPLLAFGGAVSFHRALMFFGGGSLAILSISGWILGDSLLFVAGSAIISIVCFADAILGGDR